MLRLHCQQVNKVWGNSHSRLCALGHFWHCPAQYFSRKPLCRQDNYPGYPGSYSICSSCYHCYYHCPFTFFPQDEKAYSLIYILLSETVQRNLSHAVTDAFSPMLFFSGMSSRRLTVHLPCKNLETRSKSSGEPISLRIEIPSREWLGCALHTLTLKRLPLIISCSPLPCSVLSVWITALWSNLCTSNLASPRKMC
jgi:hypothetical protein